MVDPGGVDVVLDQWHLHDGDDKTYFMEQSVAESHYVLVVCTPAYAQKANERTGGVGYEAMILTSALAQSVMTRKFIPVLRKGEWKDATPRWLSTRFGRDLRGDPCSQEEFEQLLRTLHGAHPGPPKPSPRPNFAPSAMPRLTFAPATPPAPTHETPPFAPLSHENIFSAASLSPLPNEESALFRRRVQAFFLKPVGLGISALAVVALLAASIGLWAIHSHSLQKKREPPPQTVVKNGRDQLVAPAGNPVRQPAPKTNLRLQSSTGSTSIAQPFQTTRSRLCSFTQKHAPWATQRLASGSGISNYKYLHIGMLQATPLHGFGMP